jgi:hypothetical protein
MAKITTSTGSLVSESKKKRKGVHSKKKSSTSKNSKHYKKAYKGQGK